MNDYKRFICYVFLSIVIVFTGSFYSFGQGVDIEIYHDPIIRNGNTFHELKISNQLIDYVLYDYEPLFFSLMIDDNITEFYRNDDSSYVVRMTIKDNELVQGLMKMDYDSFVESDTSTTLDPVSYESKVYVGYKRKLLKHGEWSEIDEIGRRCIGKYQEGKRIDKWKLSEGEFIDVVEYKEGEIIGYHRPRMDTLLSNINWLLNTSWYWCQNSKGSFTNSDTSIYKTNWELNSVVTEHCSGNGVFRFNINNDFEFNEMNDNRKYGERQEGIGNWELVSNQNIVKLILTFHDGVRDEMVIDYIDNERIKLVRDGW